MTSSETVIPHLRLLMARYRRERARLQQQYQSSPRDPDVGRKLALLICDQGDVERALQEVERREGTDQDE